MAGLTGQGTSPGLCVMARGRQAVGQRLKSAVIDWCAVSSVGLPSAFRSRRRVAYDRLGVQWYKAVTRARVAGLTGQGTPRGLCVMPRGRLAVGQRLKSAVVDWCAASSVGLASAFRSRAI